MKTILNTSQIWMIIPWSFEKNYFDLGRGSFILRWKTKHKYTQPFKLKITILNLDIQKVNLEIEKVNLKVKNWNLNLWTWIAISEVQKMNLQIQNWEVRNLKVAKVNLHEYSINKLVVCSTLFTKPTKLASIFYFLVLLKVDKVSLNKI